MDDLVTGAVFSASDPLALPSLKLVQLKRIGACHYREIEGPRMYDICKVESKELVGDVI